MTRRIQLFIYIISLLSLGQLQAQRQFSVGLDYTPSYTYRFLINTDGSASTASSIAFSNDLYKGYIGHNIGLSANWQWPKIRVGIGASFVQFGMRTKKIHLVYGSSPPPFDTIGISPLDTTVTFIQMTYGDNGISVPVSFAYDFYNKGKWHFGAEFKFIPTIAINTRIRRDIYYSDGRKERNTDMGRTYGFDGVLLGTSVGLTADYAITERLVAYTSPTFYTGYSLGQKGNILQIPYSIGLCLGVRLKV